MLLPIQTKLLKCDSDKIFQRMRFAGSDHEIIRLGMLEDAPHGVHIVGCPAPVAVDIDLAEMEGLLGTRSDAECSGYNLAGNKSLRAKWRFVVEEDAGGGEYPIGFSIVCHSVVGCGLGRRVRTSRMVVVVFIRSRLGIPKNLAGSCIVEFYWFLEETKALQEIHRADQDAIKSFHRVGEGHTH